jgi:uncharacterized protein (TIGR03382 family)
MKNKLGLLLGLFFAASFSANAVLIDIESLDINSNFSEQDLKTYWDNSTTAPTNEYTGLTALTGLYFQGSSNNNTLYKLTIDFGFSFTARTFDFFAGLDAGKGAEIFENGNLTFDDSSDIWWKLNWNDSDVINVSFAFNGGVDKVELYWAEGFNSGGNSFKITENVAAPGALVMMMLGLGGLLARRKIKA